MEKRKVKQTQHKILTHKQKIMFCKDYLESNGYSKIILTPLGGVYPIPDLTAEKRGITYAVECGSLTSTNKIQDLLKIYNMVIHFYECKGELLYLFYKRGNYDLENVEEDVIHLQEENHKKTIENVKLKNICNGIKNELNKRSENDIKLDIIKLLTGENGYSNEYNLQQMYRKIIISFLEIENRKLTPEEECDINSKWEGIEKEFKKSPNSLYFEWRNIK